MNIAIDLDNTITASRQSIEFLEVLTHLLWSDHKIYILTDREPNSEQLVADELDYMGIEYSRIIITKDKAQFLKDNNIEIYLEDEEFLFSREKMGFIQKSMKDE